MRIAIYSHSIAPSIDGVCRRFTAILHELVKQGHDVLLFTLEESAQDIPPQVAVVTLPHMIIPSYPGKKVARPSPTSMYLMYKHVAKFRPEVIHMTADGFSHLFSVISLLTGIPLVGSFHTDLLDLLSVHHATWFQKWVVTTKERIDSFVFDSCATTSTSFSEKLGKQGVHCEHVIITAVNSNVFNSSSRNSELRKAMTFGDKQGMLCVYVGRISREKRIDVIINAIKDLDHVYLAIVGDGPSAHNYSSMHGPEHRIYCKPRFLSHKELAEIYASSDLHVSASEFETLGNTVLEAFSCGIPVVVPRTQGFQDTVTHGDNGFLFNPGDSASAQEYIKLLQSDSKLRVRMGQKGTKEVAHRSISHVTTDLLQWYEKGIHKHRSTPLQRTIAKVLLLAVFVPFGLLAITGYDILMAVLMFFGYSPWEVCQS